MSKTSVKLHTVISLFAILLLVVIASNVPIADSHSERGDGRAAEQTGSTETRLASSAVGHASPQPAQTNDHIFALASYRFEPLLLLLFGSTLLFIGSGIKLLLSRRLRRNPGLLKSDK